MKAVLPASARPLFEGRLPADLEVSWFNSIDEAGSLIADAEIAWVDNQNPQTASSVIAKGTKLKWLFSLLAGIDAYPLDLLARRGTIVTNGSGINAVTVAEYTVMGMLVAAKRFDEVVRIADRHQWCIHPPGRTELDGSSAMIIGHGTIGRLIGDRLAAFGVRVTGVTRSGREGTLKPDQWRTTLGQFDWLILAAPATVETRSMIGTEELAAMKSTAWLINIARGTMVDSAALIAALGARQIAGAFLDTVDPEPLPTDHPLWTAPNVIHSMHLSGRSQSRMIPRAVDLLLDNLAAFRTGRAMRNVVDLDIGY